MAKRNKTPQEIMEKYSLKLDEIDKALINYKVQFPQIKIGELAEIFKMDRTSISRRMHRPLWRRAFGEFHVPAKQKIEETMGKALRVYLSLLDSKDERIKERAGRTILLSGGVLRVPRHNDDTDGKDADVLRVTFEGRDKRIIAGSKKLLLSKGVITKKEMDDHERRDL